MKIPRLSCLLALFCGLLCPGSLLAQGAGPEMPVRVLSFNLRFKNTGDKGDRSWDVRKDLAVQVITEDKPDLIGFQEALRPMLDDLGTAVTGYQEIGVGREDGKTLGNTPVYGSGRSASRCRNPGRSGCPKRRRCLTR